MLETLSELAGTKKLIAVLGFINLGYICWISFHLFRGQNTLYDELLKIKSDINEIKQGIKSV
jgi:hypothetical protein